MSLQSQMQQIVGSAQGVGADDLPALVELHDMLLSLSEGEAAQGGTIADLAKQASERVQGVVMRETDSVEEDLASVHEMIASLSAMVDDAVVSGSTPDSDTEPSDTEAEAPAAAQEHASPTNDFAHAGEVFEPDEELLEAWLPSVADTLNDIEGLLLHDNPGEDELGELRRLVHTLKGECGVVSAHNAQRVFHEAESAIDRAIEAGCALPNDELFDVLDWVRKDVDSISGTPSREIEIDPELFARLQAVPASPASGGGSPQDQCDSNLPDEAAPDIHDGPVVMDCEVDDTVREFVGEAKEHIAAAEEALLQLESTPDDMEQIATVFRAFHTIKGVAGLLNMGPIVEVAHEAEFLLDDARNGVIQISQPFCAISFAACDMLADLIGMLEEGPAPSNRAMHDLVERLKNARKGDIQPPEKRSASSASEQDQPAESAPVSRQNARRADQSVKVNTMRLDALLDMVGELVIGQQMIVQDPHIDSIDDQRTVRNLAQTSKIIRDLQEVAMSLRMVTLRGTFQKMARLVRDLAAKSGKKIAFHIEGEDTELDRNVVEEIGDPLVHMVRNACDHGIEPPEERVAAGKPEQGNLTLRAMHRGGSIVIELEDDGRGLRREKILGKAIERGVIPPDRDPADIPDSEVFNLIFAAGFSTADKVTDISGRGVGMDVVRRNIEALRGKISIHSKAGKGSTFELSLPLTMAIIDGMIVRVGTQRYVIPTLSIEQSFRPTPDQIFTTMGVGESAMVRGSILPIYRMNRMFSLDEGANSFDDSLLVVLESNGQRCCLLVDELLGQQQVVIKSLGGGITRLPGVSGGAILGDGRVALIIDVGGIFSLADRFATETTPA
ncbi:MAG: hypothetical protein Tsb0013_14120 [Phycisphaerales bacterium]